MRKLLNSETNGLTRKNVALVADDEIGIGQKYTETGMLLIDANITEQTPGKECHSK